MSQATVRGLGGPVDGLLIVAQIEVAVASIGAANEEITGKEITVRLRPARHREGAARDIAQPTLWRRSRSAITRLATEYPPGTGIPPGITKA